MLSAVDPPVGVWPPPPVSARRTPVFVVCSPRPRVGRTLVARLLAEYFIADGRAVEMIDANPQDPVLSTYLPSLPANVADTRGQMALFDRLVAGCGRPAVIDLASEQFEPFFGTAGEICFVEAARTRGIETVALFPVEDHPRATTALRGLVARFPEMTVVPVCNEMLLGPDGQAQASPPGSAPPLRIAALSPLLHGVVSRRGFSFADYVGRPSEHPTLLHHWIKQAFVAFRELELRLLAAEFAPLFRKAV